MGLDLAVFGVPVFGVTALLTMAAFLGAFTAFVATEVFARAAGWRVIFGIKGIY